MYPAQQETVAFFCPQTRKGIYCQALILLKNYYLGANPNECIVAASSKEP